MRTFDIITTILIFIGGFMGGFLIAIPLFVIVMGLRAALVAEKNKTQQRQSYNNQRQYTPEEDYARESVNILIAEVDRMSLYSSLGLSPNATNDEVKAAYRKAMLQTHPDKTTTATAQARYQQVQDAYNTIKIQRGL